MKRQALGRGLSALLSDLPPETTGGTKYLELALDQISENDFQPRESFDDSALEDLAESIKIHGVLQPVLVRPDPVKPDYYQLIAGERRLRAARRVGLDRLPAIVVAAEDLQTLELALVENLQRSDLNAIEEAQAFQELIKSFHLTQQTIAQRVRKSRESIANSLRLLALPEEVQDLVRKDSLTAGHARALVSVKPPNRVISLAKKIVRDNLSVRETERLVSGGKPPTRSRKPSQEHTDPYLHSLEALLQEQLQTKVRILRAKSGKGRIEIEFYDNSQLNALLDRMRLRLDG